MAKAKARRRKSITTQATTATIPAKQGSGTIVRTAPTPVGLAAMQAVVMPLMVTLGCWGFAIFFIFLSPDANHILFGAIAILMAGMWSVIVALRLRALKRRV